MIPPALKSDHQAAQNVMLRAAQGQMPSAHDVNICTDFAIDANAAGRADLSSAVLAPLSQYVKDSPRLWQMLALSYRAEQQPQPALDAFAQAQRLAPNDGLIAFGSAQTRYEAGLPAAANFQAALKLSPNNLEIARNLGASLAGEGRGAAGEAMLADILKARPDWLEGHKTLTTMRWLRGERDGFDASYAAACRAQPQNKAIRNAWFHALSLIKDWDRARAVIAEGERLMTGTGFVLPKLYIASESGDDEAAAALFDQVEAVEDPGLELCRIRYYLRTGQTDRAERYALRLLGTPMGQAAWPYLSTIWRLKGDARAEWLDAPAQTIKAVDLGYNAAELSELAETLRHLHTAKAPFMEQSVRGGTQTDLPLFFRADPVIQRLRTQVAETVRDYAAALPVDSTHPFFGTPRGNILFAGSWSVRLAGDGFHVAHVHPQGWISSALYVSLPKPAQMGAPPAGWISFGTPPVELGLNLKPYTQIEPKPGRLVLFPSTMWHGTLPFNDGERLVVAFDVARPTH